VSANAINDDLRILCAKAFSPVKGVHLSVSFGLIQEKSEFRRLRLINDCNRLDNASGCGQGAGQLFYSAFRDTRGAGIGKWGGEVRKRRAKPG
jgi:hypothetical protein